MESSCICESLFSYKRNYSKATDDKLILSKREVNYRNTILFRPIHLKKEGANFSNYKKGGGMGCQSSEKADLGKTNWGFR